MRRFTIWILLLVLAGYCADRDLAGRYAGEWKSDSSGNGGAYRMTLDAAPDGSWKCEAGFSLDGADIKTTTHEIKLQDSKLDVSYDFEIQGVSLRSHMMGEWSGSVFKGRYETAIIGGDGVDAGTWTAGRAK
jgi:major membrane immunogen (membrane-anchored lipoprotein)